MIHHSEAFTIDYSNFSLNTALYPRLVAAVASIVPKILESIEDGTPAYKIFSIEHARQQAESCAHYAETIKANFSDLIVIGMGGAVLNPRTAISLTEFVPSSVKIHFLDNTDPFFLQKLLAQIDLKNCAVLAISNSGQTLETLALTGVMINKFEQAGVRLSDRFFFITNKQSGRLRDVANKIDATIIEHTSNISGRYSTLTNVTSLIAQIAGVNMKEYLAGAEMVMKDFFDKKENTPAALSVSIMLNEPKSTLVNIGYLQQFDVFLEWYSQIIAESLGKEGKGVTPIRGLGPNDQHSMLQLYLDGWKDKIYSLFYVENWKNVQTHKACDLAALGGIAGRELQEINTANFSATRAALLTRKLPVRTITLKDLSARSIGALVTHSMLEIVIWSRVMHINPFNQPGIELIKTESTKIIDSKK
ncbi:MAG: hypothetical protein COA94_04370 [Rickettsiales bacterium]|nr:MAG: hypothetical protein COA94_04370 [Rickettsiales bacterium]